MDKVKLAIRDKTSIFDGLGEKVPPLKDGAAAIGMNPGFIVAVALGIFSIITLLFHGVDIAVTTYTIIYPGFRSIKAINSKEKEDDKTWLCYWMVISFLDVAETFLSFIFYFIPYYSIIRLGLFVWLINFNGSEVMYDRAKPLISAHKKDVENFIGQVDGAVTSGVKDMQAQASDPQNFMKAAGLAAQAQQVVTEAQ